MISYSRICLFGFLSAIPIVRSQTSTHSSPESEWRSFLNTSPEHMYMQEVPIVEDRHVSTDLPLHPPRGASHRERHRPVQQTIQEEINETKPSLTSRQRYYRNWKSKKESLPPAKKADEEAKTREKHQRYRVKIKSQTGFSTKHNAKMHQIRELEKTGSANDEQLKSLEKERYVRRIYAQKKRKEKMAGGGGKKRK